MNWIIVGSLAMVIALIVYAIWFAWNESTHWYGYPDSLLREDFRRNVLAVGIIVALTAATAATALK